MKSVGVITSLGNGNDLNSMKKLRSLLNDKELKILAMRLSDFTDTITDANIMLIEPKEVTWLGKPKSDEFNSFCKEQFDLLVYFNPEKLISLDYAYYSSKANLRTGFNSDQMLADHDFSIEVKEKDETINVLVKELEHYLSSIANS